MLISALEERMDGGQVWQCLQDRGMTRTKLIKEWKTKSYFLAGKAELLRKEYDVSIGHLESALTLLADDPQSSTEIVKLKELLATATKKRTAELKKEKSTWSKAFKKNNEIPEKVPEVITSIEQAENKDVRSVEEILKEMRKNSNIDTSATPLGDSKTKSKTNSKAKVTPKSKEGKKASSKFIIKEEWTDDNNNDDDDEEEEYVDEEDDDDDAERGTGKKYNSGNNDSVSDETFGWLIGASVVLSVLGAAAFVLLKARQR